MTINRAKSIVSFFLIIPLCIIASCTKSSVSRPEVENYSITTNNITDYRKILNIDYGGFNASQSIKSSIFTPSINDNNAIIYDGSDTIFGLHKSRVIPAWIDTRNTRHIYLINGLYEHAGTPRDVSNDVIKTLGRPALLEYTKHDGSLYSIKMTFLSDRTSEKSDNNEHGCLSRFSHVLNCTSAKSNICDPSKHGRVVLVVQAKLEDGAGRYQSSSVQVTMTNTYMVDMGKIPVKPENMCKFHDNIG